MIIKQCKCGGIPLKLVYTVKEASNLLNCKLRKTYELLYQNKIPCIKLGKRVLIPKNPQFFLLKPIFLSNSLFHHNNLSSNQCLPALLGTVQKKIATTNNLL